MVFSKWRANVYFTNVVVVVVVVVVVFRFLQMVSYSLLDHIEFIDQPNVDLGYPTIYSPSIRSAMRFSASNLAWGMARALLDVVLLWQTQCHKPS